MTPKLLWAWFTLLLRQPRRAMAAIGPNDQAPNVGATSLALMAVLYSVMFHILTLADEEGTAQPLGFAMTSPLATLGLMLAVFFTSGILIHVIGAARGGQGTLDGAFMTMSVLQAVILGVQLLVVAALLVLLLIMPNIAFLLLGAVVPLVLILFFWLLTGFVTALHGFVSPVRVLVGIILSLVAVNIIASFVLTLLLGPGGSVHV